MPTLLEDVDAMLRDLYAGSDHHEPPALVVRTADQHIFHLLLPPDWRRRLTETVEQQIVADHGSEAVMVTSDDPGRTAYWYAAADGPALYGHAMIDRSGPTPTVEALHVHDEPPFGSAIATAMRSGVAKVADELDDADRAASNGHR